MKTSSREKKGGEKSNARIAIIFALMLIGSMIAGFCIGGMSKRLSDSVAGFDYQAFLKIAFIVIPIVFGVFVVALIVAATVIYYKNAAEAKKWDGEDEELVDRIEARQNTPMILSSILLIGGMFFFSLCTYIEKAITEPAGKYNFVIWSILFVLSMAGAMFIQAKVIGLEKKLNPEKKGNVFDVQFLKQWEKTSDEAEKLVQYKGGYKAYKTGNLVCMLMWVVSFVGMLVFNTGFMALGCVIVIWLTLVLSYAYEIVRLENKRREK